MAKQSLDLLKRIADQLAITFHGAHWCRCVGEAALDQHGKHVDCKGMPELMGAKPDRRSEEHTSELQSLMRISYAVFCLKKKKTPDKEYTQHAPVHVNQNI